MAPHAPDRPGAWDRRRLLLGLAAIVLVAAVLVAGLVLAVRDTVTSSAPGGPAGGRMDSPTPPPTSTGPRSRDDIAAAPMLPAAPGDARPTTPATRTAPAIVVPTPTGAGPANVPAGFPHTPEGAVAQLAAIETTVLQAMSIDQSHDVYRQWALPGGAGADTWELTQNVQAFLGAAQMGPSMDLTATVVATPAAGSVKGTDGPDWAVACVLLELRATISTEAKMGYGYCERMQWHDGRWMIAPGAPPVRAPSTWPGSDLAIRAGWRTWIHDGQEPG